MSDVLTPFLPNNNKPDEEWITQDDYNKKHQTMTQRQYEINRELEGHHEGNDQFKMPYPCWLHWLQRHGIYSKVRQSTKSAN